MSKIHNDDCIKGARKHLLDNSVDLLICDAPFGIKESTFDKHYNRDESHVLKGYVEAPEDYFNFSLDWMTQAKRVLKDTGTLYAIIGHTNLRHVLNAAHELQLHEVNHLIWKYNFGCMTKRKFVTSHYHILKYIKEENAPHTFNLNCRFGSQEKDGHDGSLLFKDLESVFTINRDYAPGEVKNKNKLPDNLIEKLILYSSNEGDVVGDFFLGNFTTAVVAKRFGRIPVGFEMNPIAYDVGMEKLSKIELGSGISFLREFENIVPENQGKSFSFNEIKRLRDSFKRLWTTTKHPKNEIIRLLCEQHKRGKFSIINALEKHTKDIERLPRNGGNDMFE